MGEVRKSKVIELPGGTKKRVWGRGKSNRAAIKKLDENIEKAKAVASVMTPDTTLELWAERFLTVYKSADTKNNKTYRTNIHKHIIPAIGHLKISKIKPYQLQELLNTFEGQSYSHVHKILLALRQIFRTAAENGLIMLDPTISLKLPHTTKGGHRSITDYEREMSLKVSATHRAGLWIETMLYCGLRPQETRTLLWTDFLLDKKLVHIHSSAEAGTGRKKEPKTPAGNRYLPITNDRYLERLKRAKKSAKSIYVFVQPTTGRPHTEESMRCMWESFRREIDIAMGAVVYRNQIIKSVVAPDLVPYCYRHTYCTDMQRAGVPLNVAKYMMGHEDVTVTANTYTHHSDEDTKSAAKLMRKFHDTKPKNRRTGT